MRFIKQLVQRANGDAKAFFEERLSELEKSFKDIEEQTTEHRQLRLEMSGDIMKGGVANRSTQLDTELTLKATK